MGDFFSKRFTDTKPKRVRTKKAKLGVYEEGLTESPNISHS